MQENRMPEAERREFYRRRRIRNLALLGVLLALVVLFYFVAVTRMQVT